MQTKYFSYRVTAFLLALPTVFLLTQSATWAAPIDKPVAPKSTEIVASEPSDSFTEDPFDQVTSVSQLSDVQPTDWAFQALQLLVERYGCIAGYSDGTYRGNRAMTRYEFAAGLNVCLNRISELIMTGTTNLVTKEDLARLQKLQEEFATELATLRGRVDTLEARIAAPQGKVDLTGSTGSFLATRPFGDNIATSSDSVGVQGFYRISPHFQVHAWSVYTHANAESSGISSLSNGRGGTVLLNVNDGAKADILYGAIGLTFPDVGGKGNLPGILVGLPPHVISSDVRDERDTSYHIESFYRFQVNDHISITPGFWVIINPENDSRNDTQWVGLIRTGFNF